MDSTAAGTAPHHSKAEGWWIGLSLKLNRSFLKRHANDSQLPSEVRATIHDYDSSSGESQIWICREDDQTGAIWVDHIDLSNSDLQYECIGSITDNAMDLAIPNTKDWIPMKLDIGSAVEIRHYKLRPLRGLIDGYDSQSRRYHISYPKGQSEWMWCTNSNTSLSAITVECNDITPSNPLPPPFDPEIYKLDPSFLTISRQMTSNKRMWTADGSEPAAKRRKVISGISGGISVISPPASRIPKMTEKITSTIDLTVNAVNTVNTANTVNAVNTVNANGSNTVNTDILALSQREGRSQVAQRSHSQHSQHSQHSSHSSHSRKRTVIDLVEEDAEEIVVGTAQHREYERRLRRRKKEERRQRKKRRKSRSKGSSLYPRKARIEGRKWKRAYAVQDKRYYWTRKDRTSAGEQLVSSWNPWKDAGQIAPWLQGRSVWEKWTDEESKRNYYFNPLTRESTFVRPADYRSLDEIDHDSMEDDEYKQIEAVQDEQNEDVECLHSVFTLCIHSVYIYTVYIM